LKQSAFGFLLLAAALISSPVSAEDYKPFAGPYVGLHGGYVWEKASGIYDNAGAATNLAQIDLDSAIVGGQIGYNLQYGNWVMGLEADASTPTDSDSVTNNPGAANYAVLTADISYLASIRSRLGFVVGDVLLYGTAGVGFVEFKFNANAPNSGFDQSFRRKDTGGVWGGGLEWNVVEGVTLRGEYLHFDVKASSGIPGTYPNADSGDGVNFHDVDVARAGININLSP
jgi:outer membrane immunogenic protein